MQSARPLDTYKALYLAQLEAKIEVRVKRLKDLIASLQEALAESPELRPAIAEELRALLSDPAPETKKPQVFEPKELRLEVLIPRVNADAPPLRERMADFFRRRGNEPASIETIYEAVGGAESSVRGMLYKKPRNGGWFVRVPVAGELDNWKLSDEKLNGAVHSHDANKASRSVHANDEEDNAEEDDSDTEGR